MHFPIQQDLPPAPATTGACYFGDFLPFPFTFPHKFHNQLKLKTNPLVRTAVETQKFYCITFNNKKEEIDIILTYNSNKW